MRKLILIMALAIASQAPAKYFEPSEEVSAKEHKAIMAQHNEYAKAKKSGDWAGARENALFHFALAWSYNNEALGLLKAGWNDKAQLTKAEGLYTQAISSANDAINSNSYVDEAKDCLVKATRGRESVRKRLARLNK